MSKRKPRGIGPRRWKFNERAFKPYVTGIGQFVLAWNDLHERLGVLFWTLMGIRKANRAMGIWNASYLDRPKREILKAAICTIDEDQQARHPKLIDDGLWLLKHTENLEDTRNNIVHSPLFLLRETPLALVANIKTGVVPNEMFGNTRAARLSQKDLLAEYLWARDFALTLRDFAVFVDTALTEAATPWPDRPQLPNREQRKNRRNQPPLSRKE